jgi:hypothetical protein
LKSNFLIKKQPSTKAFGHFILQKRFSIITLTFAAVKKVCIYILLILTAAENTELHQLFKLPILFQHFAEHKQLNSQVGVIDFLSMHYWGDDRNNNDDERDMQLPFKKLDVHPLHIYFLPTLRIYAVKTCIQPLKISHPVYQHFYFPNPALSSPFRPPCA